MIQFMASLKDTGKPISFDNDQSAEIKLITPASEIPEVIKLITLCGKQFKVSIEEVRNE